MDATSDGERLWMIGADGQLACYDVSERELYEYAYPDEMPSVWDGIAISGDDNAQMCVLGADGALYERTGPATATDVGRSSDDAADLGWESVDESDEPDRPDS